jgi:hypothetical protein
MNLRIPLLGMVYLLCASLRRTAEVADGLPSLFSVALIFVVG